MNAAARKALAVINRNLFSPRRLLADSTEPIGRTDVLDREYPIVVLVVARKD